MRYRVLIKHREVYVLDASCAAEAQFIAADFATHRNNSEYADQVLEHSDESLRYECTQLEACLHTPDPGGRSSRRVNVWRERRLYANITGGIWRA